jgi:hypothetical protein
LIVTIPENQWQHNATNLFRFHAAQAKFDLWPRCRAKTIWSGR